MKPNVVYRNDMDIAVEESLAAFLREKAPALASFEMEMAFSPGLSTPDQTPITKGWVWYYRHCGPTLSVLGLCIPNTKGRKGRRDFPVYDAPAGSPNPQPCGDWTTYISKSQWTEFLTEAIRLNNRVADKNSALQALAEFEKPAQPPYQLGYGDSLRSVDHE